MRRADPATLENDDVKGHAGKRWSFFLAVTLSLGVICQAFGAGGDIVWQFGDSQAGKQQAVASVVDGNGNIIVTGYQNLAGGTNDDYWTVKFKADGSGAAWRATFDKAGGTDQATAIAVDANNDVIVTGFVWNGVNKDIQTVKYGGATGAVIWQHTFNGAANGNDIGTSIAVDSLNNVYVGGYSQNSDGNDDFVVLKYSPTYPDASVAPVWQATYNGPANGNDQLKSLTVGINGVAVTGQSWNGTAFDMVTVKYDFSGAKLWEKRYSAMGGAYGKKVRMDAGGNVIVTGSAGNGIDLDIYTAKYGSDALADTSPPAPALLWQVTYNGAYDDEPYGLDVDAAGDVYVTGYTWTLAGTNDFYTARYNGASGALVWQQIFDSGQDNTDLAIAISAAVDPAGDLFVTGYTVAAGISSFQTIKYKRDNGNQLWQRTFNGVANMNSRPVGLGLSPTGELLVAGWGDTSTNGLDCYVVKYDPGLLNPPTNLTTTTQQDLSILLTWTDNSSNEDGFKIERKLGENGTFAQIATVAPNITSYTDPAAGLTANNYYYYRVRSFNAANGNSHYSNEAHALTVFVSLLPPSWSYLYNSPDNMDDYANAIAVGPDNNPVVTGYSLRAIGGYDYFTVKLNRADKSVIWSDLYDDVDSEMDMAKCVTVDGSNNAVVSGYSQLYYAPAQKNINSIYTIKYPATGPPQTWGAQYNGPGAIDDRAVAIATTTDAANNVVVIGYGKNAASNDDIYVVKYNADGTKAWAATPFDGGVSGDDIPSGVAIAPDGSVYVTGYSEKGPNAGVYNFFTAKYNGTTGVLIWSDVYSVTSGGDNQANALAIDATGDLYVTGSATNSSGNKDIYTIKYSGSASTGQKVWERPFDGAAHGDDEGISVKVDSIDGNIIAAGTSLSNPGDHDITLIRYTSAGDVVTGWPKTLQRPANDDYATAMTVDSSGYIYLAGNTSNGASMDILSLIYNYDGTFLEASIFNGAANGDDEASSIAVNYLGEAFIAGYSTNASGNADYVVVKQTNNYILVPAPFTATPQADYGKINLSWGINTSGVSYSIERTLYPATSSSVWTPITTNAPPGTTSFQDNGLNPGVQYCYHIDASSGSITSRWSAPVCAKTTLPSPVLNPVTVVSATAIDVSWANVSGNTEYKLERSSDNVTWSQIGGNLAANTTLYHDTGLTSGSVYFYRLSAINSAGTSLASGVQTAPVLNSLGGITATGFSLSWPAVAGTTGYVLERSPNSATWTQIATPTQATTSYPDSGLASATTYYYRLKAVIAAGTSGPSLVKSATTKLQSPTLSTATASSTTQIALGWTDPNPAPNVNETGFLIEYAACTNASPPNCSDVNAAYWGGWTSTIAAANSTSLTVSGLQPGRTYRFRLTATITGANSDTSNMLTATPNLVGPANLTATATSNTVVHLSWSDVTGETNYNVLQNGAPLSGVTLAQNSISYDVTGLTAGTAYTFQVQPYNAISSALSNTAPATTPLPPPALTSVTAVSQSEIDLVWPEVCAGEQIYEIWRSAASSQDYAPTSPTTGSWQAYTLLTSPAPGVCSQNLSYQNTGITAGYTYKYKLRYKLPNGTYSAYSSEMQATTIPATPTNFTATGSSPTQVNLTWSNVIGETGYNVQLKQRAGTDCTTEDWTGITSVARGNNVLSYSATSLAAGVAYCFRVNVSNAAGSSTWSTALTKLPAPATLTLSNVTPMAITLTWSSVNVTGTSGYMVERSTDNATWSTIVSSQTATTFTDSNLNASTTYYYRVRALNGADPGMPTTTKNAVTLSLPVPTGLAASGVSPSQLTLNWINATGYSGYKVERSPDNSAWTQIATTAADVAAYTNTGLTAGTLYYYRVSIKNSQGSYSPPSSVLSVTTTPAAPSLPSTAVNVVSESRIDVTWQVILGATNYKVWQSIGPNGPWNSTNLPVAYSTSYCGGTLPTVGCLTPVPVSTTNPLTGLTENTQYCIKLTAWNATGGDSAYSNTVCQKTPAVGGPNLATVTARNSVKIQLGWTYNPAACTPNPCDTPDGFEIWKQLVSGDWALLTTVPNVTAYTDTIGIEPQKAYNYQVRAYKGSDRSIYSNVKGVTTPAYATGDNTCNFMSTLVTNGPGAITALPPGVPVSCGNNQSCSSYCAGAQVTLIAVPNSGAGFISWSGNCSGPLASCTVTMDTDISVTGTFH